MKMNDIDDERAEAALTVAVELLDPIHGSDTRLKAANTILAFTKSKPVAKKDITVRSAEDLLAELADAED